MITPFFTLKLNCKRDLLRARQLARQAADLLGFDGTDQLCLAAAVFDLVCQAHSLTGRATVSYQIAGGHLQVICSPKLKKCRGQGLEPPVLRLSKPLPSGAALPREDVSWMLRQLVELAPLDLFAEMRKINQELLATQLELARHRVVPPNHVASNVA